MSQRGRWIVFLSLAVLLIGGTTTYLLWRRAAVDSPSTQLAQPTAGISSISHEPRVVFRTVAPDQTYGKVAMVALADPGGPRAVTDLACDRVDAHGDSFLCLTQNPLAASFDQRVLGPEGQQLFASDLPGLPSRARFSPDGHLAAATGFVAGDSYLDVGFSTRTYITDVTTGAKRYLEDFTLIRDGTAIHPVDRNFWGVTFADDDTFYVTVAFGGEYWLARGSLTQQRIETIHDGAECPSLSPDHTRIVYKKRQNGENSWRLAVLDLASGKERLLAETRSVDDQVAWLDDHTILYGLPPSIAREGESDVWSLNIDGGQPTLMIRQAESPSVIR